VRGFTNLTNWQMGCAIMDSITSYFKLNQKFPESWGEIKKSYTVNRIYSGYGFEVNSLDEKIDVNFQFLKEINYQRTFSNQPIIKIEWILRLKSDSNSTLLNKQNDRFFKFVREYSCLEDLDAVP
jgi:hypothetical protein